MQDAYGVWRRARQHSLMRNRRDPSQRPTSGEGGSYKPMAKGNRVGRESEGFIVPLTPVERSDEGRDPALVTPESGGKRWGMVARPNHPHRTSAKTPVPAVYRGQVSAGASFPGYTTQRSDVPLEACKRGVLEACMPYGKPDAGNPHVRFDRGPQETEPVRHRA
jgi:hypothetical protein